MLRLSLRLILKTCKRFRVFGLQQMGAFPHYCRAALTPDSLQYIMIYNKFKTKKCVGADHDQYGPRLVGQIWSERLANGIDAFALACRRHLINSRKEVAAL